MKSNYTPNKRQITGHVFILLFISFCFLPLDAAVPDSGKARQTAELFFSSNQSGLSKVKSSVPQKLEKKYQSPGVRHTPLFIYQSQSDGFVIVAQNNGRFAIVGYSPEGKFRADSVPPQLKSLLKLYEDSLQFDEDNQIARANAVVAPLLDQAGVNLDQFSHSQVGGCPTGCIATAFTQIMAYHRYPNKGTGSNCYTHATYGQLCADFENTVYNWTNPTYEDYEKLSYHVGISMNMNYCGSPFGSIPSSSDYIERIHKHFGYYIQSGPFAGITSQSVNICSELDNRRPVYAELPGNPGHAVVLDGYDTNGFFHIHFGWGGLYNGYYALNTNSTFKVGYKFGTNIQVAVYMSPTVLKTNVQDSLALVAFHNSFNGTTGWDLKEPVFTWRGVLVINGRVVSLFLNNGSYLQFKGTIPPETGNLTALQRLNLLGQFDGELPAEIARLTELRELCIYGGQGTFKAVLPQNIGNLTKLETLAIPFKAEGEIPVSISNLTQLKNLDLSNGNLTGTIPAGIANLTKLENLTFFRNKLTGNLPQAIGNLTQLQTLSLGENLLSGNIPSGIGNLTRLTALFLSNNMLTGDIPASIGNCRLLTNLYLSDNQLTGNIPAEIGNLVLLENLTLKNNQFESLPNEIGRLKKVYSLDVCNNKLRSLPDSIVLMDRLYELYAQNNRISGLSENFGVCKSMKNVNLSNNQLKEIPVELFFARNIESIGLSNNLIEKFPSNISIIPPKLQGLNLDNNNLSGKIPAFLVTNPQLSSVLLRNNRFIYEDLPDSAIINAQLGTQQRVGLSKKVFKVAMGDTVRINIKDITPFKRKGNKYYWCLYPKYFDSGETGDFQEDSILKVVISEKTINNRYYCKVSNPEAPNYKYEIWTLPVLNYVATDTLSFKLSTDEEIIAEKYPQAHVVNALDLPGKIVDDRIVTLVPPLKYRGNIKWQASSDKTTWYDLSTSMAQNDLKANFLTVKSNELVLTPKTPAYYRCMLQDTDCEPMYSDTIRVNPFGKVLLDSVVNVDKELIKVKTDSIEITVPKGIHEGDFRLTVVKLDNPPAGPDGVKLSSVYDVTVSFGNVFDIPMLIKFRNLPKNIDPKKIDNYKGAYYDDMNRKWVKFNNSFVSLKDSTFNILTNHLTKLSWWIYEDAFLYGYNYYLQGERVNVMYTWAKDSENDKNFIKYESKVQDKPRPWRSTNTNPEADGNPVMIQDIAANLDYIIKRFEALGLETPFLRFNVYVTNLDDEFASIGTAGYLSMRGYFKFNIKKAANTNEEEMRKTLAHEYMHYTQDYYMTVLLDNYFFQEVHAPLADRLVWPEKKDLENPENEALLRDSYNSRAGSIVSFDTGEYSIFDLLSESWDHDATLPVVEKLSLALYSLEANLSGSFLHYMRSYRTGTKLDIVKLLKEHGWINSVSNWTWRAYLNSQTEAQFNTSLGDEFDDYVRFLLEGSEEKFTLLDLTSKNLYNHIITNAGFSGTNKGTFAQSLNYNFSKDKSQPQKDNIDISVPYLAAKMVLLTNQTTDKNVLINYKRKHDKNDEYNVYHGRYDLKEKKVVYVDISDSLEYNFLIEPFSDKDAVKHQNIQFILLVNKKCPSVVGVFTTFNASFELTATPVYDVTSLLTAYLESKSKGLFINNFSGNSKRAFLLSGAHLKVSTPNLTYHTINSYSSSKTLLGPTEYRVSSFFDSETRYDFEDNTPGITTLPSIQNTTRNMTVTYDCIKGTLKINMNAHIINKYETIYEEKPRIVKSSEWFENGSMDLVKISNLTYGSEGVLFFLTNNSAETRAVIRNLSYSQREVNYNVDTGAVTSENTSNYIDTDYSMDDIKLLIMLNTE